MNNKLGIIDLEYGWTYYKPSDNLNYGGICLYESGQWAKKIEDIRIGLNESIIEEVDDYFKVSLTYSLNKPAIDKYRAISKDLNSDIFKTFWDNMRNHFKVELLDAESKG